MRNILRRALYERHKSNVFVEELEKAIVLKVEEHVYERYRKEKLLIDGHELELYRVHVYVDTSAYDSYMLTGRPNLGYVHLTLGYFCTSKLPADKRRRIAEAKDNFRKDDYLRKCEFKLPLWRVYNYGIEMEDALRNRILLYIEDDFTNINQSKDDEN